MKTKNFLQRATRLYGILLIIALIMPLSAFSQNGVKVSTAVNNQINPVMTTDGSQGVIIAWQDKRNNKSEIFAQRMSSNGGALWAANGIPICTQDSNFTPVIVSDGSGGAIIAWLAFRGTNITSDIYAQRVNSSGSVLWTLNGVPVCVSVFKQDSISMVSDSSGGVILTWQDHRANTVGDVSDIYAQRIDMNGVPIWTTNGVSICNEASAQRGPRLVGDGSGGAFITWSDKRATNYDIYTQHVGPNGAMLWTTNGVMTNSMNADQVTPDICSDGAGGVIVTWSDFQSTTDFNIYAQRHGPSSVTLWPVGGVVINNNSGYDQKEPKIVSDGLGGAIISWYDYITGITADIYAQRISPAGAVQWTATGVAICTAAGDQIKSQLVSDGNNGAYISWEDHRNVGNSDIYAQRIASNAAVTWSVNGFALCTTGNDQLNPMIVSNGNFGCSVVWQDYRSGNNFDIYETGFNTTGFITDVGGITTTTPLDFSLLQNYPNPFNPATVINYQLPNTSNVRLSIYDALGHEVSTLVNKMQNAGNYNIEWNASSFPSGVYFYRLTAGSFVANKKMILIK